MWIAIGAPLMVGAFALVLERVEAWLDRTTTRPPATAAEPAPPVDTRSERSWAASGEPVMGA